jgi:saccharopine dehydrogenase-like NADP-dependent oxidoreductase
MSAFDQAAKDAGVLFLNECGLDPGIDHLSAMKVIDELKAEGATITRFASYCGGLIAPESDNNPWNYKITWNPMNVVLAGQGGITKFLDQGQLKYMPYAQLFGQATAVSVKGLGLFDAYPNRDSVGYVRTYGLEGIQTFIRGTLRRQGYCTAWQALVTLGYTDNTYTWPLTETTTWAEVTASFVPKAGLGTDLRQTTAQYLGLPADDIVLDKLAWLGLFEDTPVRLLADTPAKLLLARIEAKWVLAPYDKDLVVMQHQFDYTKADGSRHTRHADLAFVGQTQEMTAMAMGVGYPIGIAAKLIGLGQLKQTGVQIPLSPDYYEPILAELMALGITFDEYEV